MNLDINKKFNFYDKQSKNSCARVIEHILKKYDIKYHIMIFRGLSSFGTKGNIEIESTKYIIYFSDNLPIVWDVDNYDKIVIQGNEEDTVDMMIDGDNHKCYNLKSVLKILASLYSTEINADVFKQINK